MLQTTRIISMLLTPSIALFVTLNFCQQAIASEHESPEKIAAEAAVNKSLQVMAEAYRLQDAKMLTSPNIYFSDDASPSHYVLFDVMPPFADVGFKTLLLKNIGFMDATGGPVIINWTDKYIDSSGDLAFFRGIMHVQLKYKDGRDLQFALRHTIVFKKIDGRYLVIHEHASVPDASVGVTTPKQ